MRLHGDEGRHFVQFTVHLAAAERRRHVIIDEVIRHGSVLQCHRKVNHFLGHFQELSANA
jgi:hypothetical protein